MTCQIVYIYPDRKVPCGEDGEEYTLPIDGGKIVLCAKHASWQSALGRSS